MAPPVGGVVGEPLGVGCEALGVLGRVGPVTIAVLRALPPRLDARWDALRCASKNRPALRRWSTCRFVQRSCWLCR